MLSINKDMGTLKKNDSTTMALSGIEIVQNLIIYIVHREVCPNFGFPALTSSF